MLNIQILFTNYDIITDFLNLAFCSEHFIRIKHWILATFNINKKFNSDSMCAFNIVIIPPLPEGGGGYTVLPLSVLPSVQDVFRRILLSNCWWQKFDIWSQASYRYIILWVAFLDPSDFYFLFAEERGYHKWALAHSSSGLICIYLYCSAICHCCFPFGKYR
jgi:hypothetical protein